MTTELNFSILFFVLTSDTFAGPCFTIETDGNFPVLDPTCSGSWWSKRTNCWLSTSRSPVKVVFEDTLDLYGFQTSVHIHSISG
ncbi:hypothetical protein M3Y96_00981900 [Aphelenchoides besseyi]|nr:hypothetical protein M3Y96_00981900 [Aphelenchoides besseyi]